MHPNVTQLVSSGTEYTDTHVKSWAQDILNKASQDTRQQPWKRAFAAKEVNVLSPQVADIIKFDHRSACANAEAGN
ncbi:hypothetical protein CBS147311_773 [Penicillium roqueforti]|nr:hypothetical protein CBS147311_773 [Penicillium roqueforti]